MKLFDIIIHPAVVLTLFSMLLINGEGIGGPYLFYLLLALPHGSVHSLAAMVGTALIIVSNYRHHRGSQSFLNPIMDLIGICALYFSLFWFFQHSWSFNSGTFERTVPVITFILFFITSLAFLIRSFWRYLRRHLDNSKQFPI